MIVGALRKEKICLRAHQLNVLWNVFKEMDTLEIKRRFVNGKNTVA
jgi:hypothetical protein